MSNWIVLPGGNAITASVIKSISLYANGVMCRDAQQKILAYIRVPNAEIGQAVRDKLIGFARDGHIAQPDWDAIFGEPESK